MKFICKIARGHAINVSGELGEPNVAGTIVAARGVPRNVALLCLRDCGFHRSQHKVYYVLDCFVHFLFNKYRNIRCGHDNVKIAKNEMGIMVLHFWEL